MAIENIGLYPITIDVYKKHKETTVYANDNDLNGRGLLINLVKNNSAFDSTGIALKIGFRNAVGEERLYDCDIVDALIGQYKVFYPTEMLSGNGGRVVKLEIKAYESTGALLNYAPLFVYVNASEIPDDALGGMNEVSTLTQAILDVETFKPQMETFLTESNAAIVASVSSANTATNSAIAATNNANTATTSANNKIVDVENRFTALTASQQADAEVIDARQGELSLGANLTKFSAQLGDIENKFNYTVKGKIELPEKYDRLGFDLYIDIDNKIQHTFDIDAEIIGTSIFVSELFGVDTNDGLNSVSSVRSLEKAIQIGNAHPDSSIIIEFRDKVYTRNYSGVVTQPLKNYTFRAYNADNETMLTSAERNLSWVADGTAYRCTRSGTVQVCDTDDRSEHGIPKALKKVNSVAECKAEKGTWYTDGSGVWIRRFNDLAPTGSGAGMNILVLLSTAGFNLTVNDKKIIQRNLIFLKPTADAPGDNTYKLTGNQGATLINDNVKFAYGARNGMMTDKVGKVMSFNCVAPWNGSDGFNYHANYVADPCEFAFEYNCIAYDNGSRDLDGSGKNNASTAHEGMTVLRVNTLGHDCDGPIIADVNGCDSYNIRCKAYNSIISGTSATTPTKAAYWFDEVGALKDGEVYLIDCEGGGVDTHPINSDGTMPIYVKNFTEIKATGTNIKFI